MFKRVDYSWSDAQKMPMSIITGTDLYTATHDTRYKIHKNYIIVEWPDGGYSALEIPPYQKYLPHVYVESTGEKGRTYKFKRAPASGRCAAYK